MFRPLLGHLQALWENRSKIYLYFNALWDPKCLQIVFHTHITQSVSAWDPHNALKYRKLLDLFSQRA